MSNNNSFFRRVWNLITGKTRKGVKVEEPPLRENLEEALNRLSTNVDEAEEAFSNFLVNLRDSEATYNDLKEKKEHWSHEVQSISEMYNTAQANNEGERRLSQIQEGLRRAVTQEIKTEKQVQKQKELLEKQQDIKDRLAQNIAKIKDHRDSLKNKMNELTTREQIALTEKELYSSSSSHQDNYSREVKELEQEVRENEYLVMGFKELNDSQYSDLNNLDAEYSELEAQLTKEIQR